MNPKAYAMLFLFQEMINAERFPCNQSIFDKA